MATTMTVVMAQLNPVVGDIEGNVRCIQEAARAAIDRYAADVIVFPELMISGYPPEDLLLRPGFYDVVDKGMQQLTRTIHGIQVIVGFPERTPQGVYNSAALITDGHCTTICRKQDLPNYSVFDEKRYFISGEGAGIVDLNGMKAGITICEDIWTTGPAGKAAAMGAQCIINLNASPFHTGKQAEREAVLAARVKETGLPILYINMVGGQDELVFDGCSVVMNSQATVTQRSEQFAEGLFPVKLEINDVVQPVAATITPPLEEVASVWQALVTGVRDYINKNGFKGVVLGLSGGIDSAVTLAVAVDALGPTRVEAVSMPSRYTADMSIEDARLEAEALGILFRVIEIEHSFESFLRCLEDEFAGMPVDTTEENIQARCRGVILMAIANKKGLVVLTTGNKSEMAVGYATLYGDMAGGYDVLKDVPKMLVYALAKYRNSITPIIPQRVIERPPSAELAPDQKDTDSLPPYEILDEIVRRYIELDESIEDIVAAGFDEAVVTRVARMIDRNEYKRRQAPPGVRITRRAFGRDRRYPLTSGFRNP